MGEARIKCGGTEHYGRAVKAAGKAIDLLPHQLLLVGIPLREGLRALRYRRARVPEQYLEKVREKLPPVP